jgi:hypothetical protein
MAESYADIAQVHIAPSKGNANATKSETRRATRRRDERFEFYLLYACCFGIFLVAVATRRVLIALGLMDASDGTNRSIIKEAREAVGSALPYAFMG